MDNEVSRLINRTIIGTNGTHTDVANSYVGNLSSIVKYYKEHAPVKVFTADYGLYWFDYKSNYNSIFAEFVGNQSRERHIALCRGAADAFDRDWVLS